MTTGSKFGRNGHVPQGRTLARRAVDTFNVIVFALLSAIAVGALVGILVRVST